MLPRAIEGANTFAKAECILGLGQVSWEGLGIKVLPFLQSHYEKLSNLRAGSSLPMLLITKQKISETPIL